MNLEEMYLKKLNFEKINLKKKIEKMILEIIEFE